MWSSQQHGSAEAALVVEDYPYGFRERTKIRYWIETDLKHQRGQRFCSQTINPRTGRWNNPRQSTYSPLILLFREAQTGHIKHAVLNKWRTLEEISDFEQSYGAALTSGYESECLAFLKELALKERTRPAG